MLYDDICNDSTLTHVWVTSFAVFEKDEKAEEAIYGYMFTKNAFVDKINGSHKSSLQHEEVGSLTMSSVTGDGY